MAPRKRALGAATAFPNKEESLALQASLLKGEAALSAWETLSREGSVETGGVAWIGPLLMNSLVKVAPNDPWVKANPHFLTLCRLKGRAVTDTAEASIAMFDEAGIRTLILKGLALGATVYEWPGLRTVSDVDLLVPREQLFAAFEILTAKGWMPGAGAPRNEADLRANHAHPFHSGKSHVPSLDLHWHVLASARGDDDDATFWQGAQPVTIGSTQTLALGPEDQLLHVLVHGVRWTRVPHVRWVADAVLVLRHAGAAFNADRFIEALQRFDAVTPAQEGLKFIVELLGEGREVYERVRGVKRSRFAQRAFKARATAYETRTMADRIALRIESAVWARRATQKTTKT